MKLESLVLELFADTSRLDREVKAAVDKAANQIKKLEQGALSVKVNEKPLHDLNRLLDVKQAHIKQTAEVFNNTLLAVRVDDSQVSDANSELKSLKNELRGIQDKTINVKVSQSVTADLKTANNGVVSAVKDLGKGLRDVVSAVKSANKVGIGGMVGGLLKTALTVPFNVAEGALEGLGRDLTAQIASGFTDEIDTALSQKFGSPKAIGIVAGKSIVGRVQNTIDGVDKWIDDQIDAEIKQQGKSKKKTQKRESLEFIRSVLDDIGTFVDEYVPDDIKTEQGRVSVYERESSKAKTKAKAKKGLVNQAESQSRVLTAFESALAIENQFTEPIGKYKKMAAVVNQRIAAAELRNQEISILMESAQKKGDQPIIEKLKEEYAKNEKTIIDSGNEAELISNQLKPVLASKAQSVSSVTSGLNGQELAQLNGLLSAYSNVTSSSGNIGQLGKQLEQLDQAKAQNKAKYRDGDSPNLDVADRIDLLIDNAILGVEKQIQSIKESAESEQRKLDAVLNGYNSSRLEIAGMDDGFSVENSKKALSLSNQRAAKAKANAAQFQAKLESLRGQRDQLSANIDKEELEKESKRNLLKKKKSRIDNDIWLNEDERQAQKQSIDSEILAVDQLPSKYSKSDLSDIDKRIANVESKFQLAQKVVLSEQSIIQSLQDKIKKNSLAVYNVVTLLSELSGQKMSIEDAPEIVVADELLKQRKANAVYDVASNVVMVSKSAFDLLQSVDLEKKENAKVLQVLAHELTHALDLDMGSDYGLGASFAGGVTRQRPNITVGDYLGQGLGKFISPYKANSNFEQIRPLELNAEYLANQYIASKFDDVNFESPLPRLQGFSSQLMGQSSDLLDFLESQPTVAMPVERKGAEIKENADSQGIEVYNQSKAKTNRRLNKETVIEYEQVSIVSDLIKKVKGLQSLQETIENNIGKLVALQSKDISGMSQDDLDKIEVSLKVQINNLSAVKNKINLLSKEVSARVESYSSYTQENTNIESLLDDAINLKDLSKLQEARKRIATQIKSIKNDSSLDDKTKSVLIAQSKLVGKKAKQDTKEWDAPSMGDIISNPMESLQLAVDKSTDRVVEVFTQVGDAISDAGERIRDVIESVREHPLESLQAVGGVALDAGKGALSVANKAVRGIAPAVSGGYGVMKGLEGAVLDVLPYGRLTKKAIQVGAVAGGIPLAAAAVPALAPVAGALGAVGHLGGGLAGSAVAGQLGAVGSIPIVGGQVASMITAGASGLGTVVTEMVVAATALNAAIKGAQIVVNKAIEPSTKETFKALAPSQETIRTRVESKTKKQISKLEQYAQDPESLLGQLLPSQRDLVAGYLPTLSDSVKSLRGDFVPKESEFKGLANLDKKQFAALPAELQDTVRKDAVDHYKRLNTILNELTGKFNSTAEGKDRMQGAFPTLLSQVSGLVDKAKNAVSTVGINPNEVVRKMTKEDRQSFTLDVDAVRMPDMSTLERSADMELVGKAQAEGIESAFTAKMPEVVEVQVSEVEKARQAVKRNEGINSPAKVWEDEIGKPLGQGVEAGAVKAIKKASKSIENEIQKITGHGTWGNAFLAVGYDIVESLMNGMEGFEGGIESKIEFLENYVKSGFEVISDLPKVTGTPQTFPEKARKLIEDIGGQGYASPGQLESAKGLFPSVVADYSRSGAGYLKKRNSIILNPSLDKKDIVESAIHEYTHFLQMGNNKGMQGEIEKAITKTGQKAEPSYVIKGATASSDSLISRLKESIAKDGETPNDDEIAHVRDRSMNMELEAYANESLMDNIQRRNFFRVDAGHVAKFLKTGQGYAPMFNPPSPSTPDPQEKIKLPQIQAETNEDVSIQGIRLSLLRTIKKLTKDFPDFADNLIDLYGNIRGDLESLFDQTDSLNVPKGDFKFNVPTDDLNKKLYQLLYGSLPESYLGKSKSIGVDPSKFIESGGAVSFNKIPSNLTDSLSSVVSQELPELQSSGELIGKSLDKGTKKALEIASPSKLYIRHGKDVVIGFEMGVNGEIKRIKDLEIPIPELEKEGYIDLEGLAKSVDKIEEYKEIYNAVMDSWATNLDVDNPESTAKVSDNVKPLIDAVESVQKQKAKHAQVMASLKVPPITQSIGSNNTTRIAVPNVPDPKRGQWLKPNIYNNTQATSWVSGQVNDKNFLGSLDKETADLLKRLKQKSVKIDEAVSLIARDTWLSINEAIINSQSDSLESSQELIQDTLDKLKETLKVIDNLDIEEGTLLQNSQQKLDELVNFYGYTIPVSNLPEIGITAGSDPFSVSIPELTPDLLSEYDAVNQANKGLDSTLANQAEDFTELLARVSGHIETLNNTIDIYDQSNILMDDGYDVNQAVRIASNGNLPPVPPLPPILDNLRQQFPIIDQAIAKFNQLKDTIVSFGTGAAKLLVFAFLGKQLVDLGAEAVNVYRRFEGIFIASRLVGDGAKYLEKVREQTKALGGDLESTMRSAIQFSTALVGTNLESTGQQLFLDSDKALKSLGLQTQEYDNAMRAIIQISSKGKVSMEELSGQLGEQVPGALQIAADAMQTNVKGLIQMVSSGNLLSEDFVPKFVQQLKNRTAFLAPAVEASLNASLGRLGAQKEDLFVNIGAELSPAVIPLVNALSGALKGLTDNFDAVVFSAKTLGLYLASPAILGGLRLISTNAMAMLTGLISMMAKTKVTAQTMWSVVAGPAKLAGFVGAMAGIDALIYAMNGGAKTFKDTNEELSRLMTSLNLLENKSEPKGFWATQSEIIPGFWYDVFLKPMDEDKTRQDLDSLSKNLNTTIEFTTSRLDTAGIDEYVEKASQLQARIDKIRAERDFLMMEDPVKNKDIISSLESQLYNKDDGLIVKVQPQLNDAFAPGGRAMLEGQIKVIEETIAKIKLTPSLFDDGWILDYQFKLEKLRAGLAVFDAAQEKVSNNLNKQRLAWIELTSSIAGYEYQLNRSITKAETQLYNFFNQNNIGTEMQSYLVAEFDVARQQAEVDKLTNFLDARARYLDKSLTTDNKSLIEQTARQPVLEIDSEGIDRIEKMIQNNDTIKSVITDQVLEQLQAIAQDSQALEQANLELAKGKNSLRQARITEQEYRLTLSRSIFDFNNDLGVQLLNIQNQFRDYNRQLEDAAINSAKMVRGLIESYQDLNYDLENNILTVQNEILDAQERLKLTNFKIQNEQFDPGQDTIAKRAGSIILRLFESINGGESEKRRKLQESNQAQKEYTDTLRRVRDFEEQVLQEQLNQKRQIEDLTNGFKNLNQAVKDLVEQLNRSREDLIRNTKNQSGRDVSGQLNSVPSRAEMGAILPPPPPPIQGAIYAPLPTQQVALPASQQLNPVQATARPNPNESPTIRYGSAVVPQVRQVPTTLEELTRQNGGNFQDFSGNSYQTTPRQNTSPAPQIQSVAPVRINLDTNGIPDILARLVVAEAGNQDLVGQALVARSVENRQRVNKPGVYLARSNSLEDIITAPGQYEPVRSRNNNINKPRPAAQIERAYQAIVLGRDSERLKAELAKQGKSQTEINQLLNSTGFRTPSAKNDNSQNFNRVRYGGHIFNSDQYGRQRLQSNLNFGVTGFENVRGQFAQSQGQLDVTQSPLEWLKKDLQRTLEPVTNLFNKVSQEGNINPPVKMELQRGIAIPQLATPKVENKPQSAQVTPTPNLTPYPEIEQTPYPDIKPQRVAPFKGFEFKPNYNPLVVPFPEIKATPDMVQPDFGRVVTQIPDFPTQDLRDKAASVKTLKEAFTQISLSNIEADKKLASLTAISEMSQLVMTTADSIRQMNFNLVASADTVERMRKESKGYLTVNDEINNVVLDTARNYDNEINSRRESVIQLEREVGTSQDQLTILKEQLSSRADIDAVTKQTLINEITGLEGLIQYKNQQAEILKGETQRLENNRQIAIYNKQIREEQQRQMALAKELSDAQLTLANARYDMGGGLFNTGVIKAAREDAIQIEYNAKIKAESWNGFVDPKVIQEYVDGQRELAQINIAKSYLDAIPALRDFSSGLKDIILMTSTWQEVTKKLIDTLAGLVLDTLVIKPMQNWLAQGVAGMMGWMGESTAPTDLSISNRKPNQKLDNTFIDTSNALGLFNQNLLQSNSILPDFTNSLLSLFTGSNQNNDGGFGDIIGAGASLITGSGILGFAKGTDEVGDSIVNLAMGTDSLDILTLAKGIDILDNTIPTFAKGTDNLEILTLAKGIDILDNAIPNFAKGADNIDIDLMTLAMGDDNIGENIINLAKGTDRFPELETFAKGTDELDILTLATGINELVMPTLSVGSDSLLDVANLAQGTEYIDKNIVNLANGTDDLDIDFSTFARGSIKVDVPNFAAGSIERAFKKERLESGGKIPFLAVLHKGEAVLSTLNRDAQLYRHLKATGQWEHLKAGPRVENYAYGTVENIVNRPQAQIKGHNQTTIYRPEYKIYTENADSFRKSQRQIEQESMSRMRRRPR